MQRSYLGIDNELLEAVRRLAAEQDRDEREVIEEALRNHLIEAEAPTSGALKRLRREQEQQRERDFVVLLDRMSSRFDLSEDAAMDLATSEIQAMREERRQQAAREREGDLRSGS
jgi:CheY-like chemotaxis protein